MAAGITYVPPLLLEAGVEERYMTMVLGKGPRKNPSGAPRGSPSAAGFCTALGCVAAASASALEFFGCRTFCGRPSAHRDAFSAL